MAWFRRGVLLNLVFQGIDGLLTFYGLKYCGGVELNPLIGYLIEKFGLEVGLIITKTAVIVILIYFLKSTNSMKESAKYYTYLFCVFGVLNLIYAFIIGLGVILIYSNNCF